MHPPCKERRRTAARGPPRAVHLVVIQQALAYDKKVVIAAIPIGAARTTPKKDDCARMQPLNETFHRLGKLGILYRLLHVSLYIGARAHIQSQTFARGDHR